MKQNYRATYSMYLALTHKIYGSNKPIYFYNQQFENLY